MIYCDLDEVLRDFVTPALGLFGRQDQPCRTYDGLPAAAGVSEKDFWHIVSEQPTEFFATMPAYPWTKALGTLIGQTCGWIQILTAAGSAAKTAPAGARAWLLQNFGSHTADSAIFEGRKYLYAFDEQHARPNVLVDDDPEKIAAWEESGGHGILFPAPWNGYGAFDPDPVAFVRDRLKHWK